MSAGFLSPRLVTIPIRMDIRRDPEDRAHAARKRDVGPGWSMIGTSLSKECVSASESSDSEEACWWGCERKVEADENANEAERRVSVTRKGGRRSCWRGACVWS